MNFLAVFIAIFFALVFARPLLQLAFSIVPVSSIQRDSLRQAATASLAGLVYASTFSVAYLVVGIGTSLLNFLVLWALMTAIELVMPSVRT